MVRSHPHDMQVVQKSLQTAFETSPVSGLGILECLPAELISLVLYNLDILSYSRFRQVNRRARVCSTALREYELVAKYGLEGLRGLLRGGLAHKFTIMDLYRPLIAYDCELCGMFGGFLYLITVTRCCFACIQDSPQLRVICTSAYSKVGGGSTARLNNILGPPLRTVPGIYSMMERPARRPKDLRNEWEAITTMVTRSPYVVSTEARAEEIESRKRIYSAKRQEQKNQRFMASTAFPWYDIHNNKIERGVSCKGCQVRVETSYGKHADRDRVFSATGFLSHFAHCVESQSLWAESKDGTMPTKEPEFTRRCGYFSNEVSNSLCQ